MVVIAIKMLSVTSRRKSSCFQSRNSPENLWLCQTFPGNVSAVAAKPHDSVPSWKLFLLFQNLHEQIAVQFQKILVHLCLLHHKSVLLISESCAGVQTCQSAEMPSCVFPAPAISPRHHRSTFLRHIPSPFQILKPFLWGPYYGTYTLVIGRMVQLWGEIAQKFLYSLCCPNQRQLWALLMLWVAGWYPTNCCSSDLSDNFCRNPVQQKRAGRVWGSALPHPRGMQCRRCTVMVPLEIYAPVWRPRNDISLGAF